MKKERREMGRRRGRERERETSKSYTLPSSPSGSSSSDFEFTISISPRKTLCPADELFYKGQLLPLHLSERISMVRTLLLSSSTSSSSSSTSPRDSTSNDSHSSFDSSRPSSATDDDDLKRLHPPASAKKPNNSKYFSFSRFSSVFRKETNTNTNTNTNSSVKRISVTAREVIRKYLKKVKPLYDKLSQKHNKTGEELTLTPECVGVGVGVTASANATSSERSTFKQTRGVGALSHSFSGNLRYPRRRSCVSSCPSSMRSSPNHSGVLSHQKLYCGETSSMEELQSAIQGAIAHCKNSLTQNKTMVSNEI